VWRQNGVTCRQQSPLNCWKRELRKLDAASGRSTAQMTQPQSAIQEVLAGYIERVTYHNAENGFCVLRTKVRGHRDVVTVVGYAAAVSAGEWITASGEWVNDRTHGQQFKARFLRTSPPTSADGVEKYLNAIERIVVAALEAAE
jgi:hypothetical protein